VQREIPSAGNRRALMEKGDIDITYEMPPKDLPSGRRRRKHPGVQHADRNALGMSA
jgi:hypothetical protein